MLTRLGKYELRRELGKGAMGVVYLAQDVHLGRPAALKVMSPSLASDPELLKRFYREAISVGKLSHPNIVTIYDIDEADGIPFIAMEFLEGQTLQQMVDEGCSVPLIRKIDIVTQAAKALHFAHQNGVIHRDIKPSNVVVLTSGTVKIVDFGIARVEGIALTRPGSVLGTPYYMSPEQVRGESVDGRSDVFSLGVILYEMVALKNPFAGRDVPSSLNRICRYTPQPLPELIPDCPPELQRIVQKATAKNREDRYQSAEDMFLDTLHLSGTLKRTTVDQHVQQGQRLLREGNLPLAEDILRKALAVDSTHNLARSLLREVQEQVRARQRQDQVQELLGRAQEAALSERDQECFDLASDALALEPESEKAQLLRREAAGRMEAARLGLAADRLVALRAQALQAVEKQDFEKALSEAAQALLEFPDDAELQELRQRAEGQLETHRQEVYVDNSVRAAQELMSGGQWSDALALLGEALGNAPANDRLLALQRVAVSEQAEARSEAARREAIAEAQALIEQRRYTAAQEQLERTVVSVGPSSELTALLAIAAEEQRKEHRVQEIVTQATFRLREGDYDEAIRLLDSGRDESPSPEIEAILRSAREEQAARELPGTGEASQVVEALKSAPETFAAEEELQNLSAEIPNGAETPTTVFSPENEVGTALQNADTELERQETSLSGLELLPGPHGSSRPLDHLPDDDMRDPALAPKVNSFAHVLASRPRLVFLTAAALILLVAVALRASFHRKGTSAIVAQTPVTKRAPTPDSSLQLPVSAAAAGSNTLPGASPLKRIARKGAPPDARAASTTVPGGKAAISPRFGQLTITSDLNGAGIVLDGQGDPSWTTPHTFDKLKPGTHHVGLLMAGHPGTYADTMVEAGISRTFNLPMQRPTGAVFIKSEPPGLQVLIDGQSCGPTPVQKNLNVGRHTWTIILPTGPHSEEFDLPEGGLKVIRFPARGEVSASSMGSVVVRSNPQGATVFLDGKVVAKTNATLKLSPGQHSLTLSLSGCPPESQSVVIPAGGSASPIDKQFHCN